MRAALDKVGEEENRYTVSVTTVPDYVCRRSAAMGALEASGCYAERCFIWYPVP